MKHISAISSFKKLAALDTEQKSILRRCMMQQQTLNQSIKMCAEIYPLKAIDVKLSVKRTSLANCDVGIMTPY